MKLASDWGSVSILPQTVAGGDTSGDREEQNSEATLS